MIKFLILVSLLSFCNAFAANIFNDNSVINIELEYNIARLQAEKENLREDGIPGKFKTISNSKTYQIKVLSRGKGSFSCKQPQLKLKFNKKENKGTQFSGIKKVKLFTKGTCLDNDFNKEQDKEIIANYLIYKLYEEVTNYSFRVRLLKIKYIDSSKTYPVYEQYGFLLEPKKVLEKRLALKYVEIPTLFQLAEKIPSLTNPNLLSIVNGFEFFIANYDYGIPGFFSHIINSSEMADIYFGEKNSKMFKKNTGEMFPIIYDFDFSRFGYMAPICTFGYPFFATNYNMECSVNVIASNIKNDLNKFKYSIDVHKNSDKMLKALSAWRKKYSILLSMLGKEYLEGLNHFPTAFQKVINEVR